MMNLFESGTARVRKAKFWDIEEIASNMRQADIDEVWASHHLTPKEAVERSFKDSVICLTIELAGKAIGIFGITPGYLITNKATLWLLGSNKLSNINHKLLKRSREFIKILLTYYPYLDNYVSIKNEASIRWLLFCGCTMEEPRAYGIEGQFFRHFYFERKN